MSKLIKNPVIGKIYRDTPYKKSYSTYLKYIGVDVDGDPCFIRVGGHNYYIEIDGVIRFGRVPYIFKMDKNESYEFLGENDR